MSAVIGINSYQKARDAALKQEELEDRRKKLHLALSQDKNNIPYSTPDYPKLLARPNWVFTYGTLMSGHSNNYLLEEDHKVGAAMTVGNKFLMYRDGTSYPYVEYLNEPQESNQYGKHIYGELYQVSAETMLNLDELEGNNFHYKRSRINVFWNFSALETVGVEDLKKEGKIVQCWMYLPISKVKRDAQFVSKFDTIGTVKGINCYMHKRGPAL